VILNILRRNLYGYIRTVYIIKEVNTMEDKKLTCVDCGKEFIFTAREQEFYAQKGFSEPKRCKECREAKKAAKFNNKRHFDDKKAA
jgi:hypothetical protein